MPSDPVPPAITISRHFGCLGTEAGFRVARAFKWAFYDRRILRKTAEALGLSVPALEAREERSTGLLDRVLSVFALGTSEVPYTPLMELPIYSLDLFRLQADLMRRLAAKGPSVFVGRGAFVALAGRPNTLHVHIRGELEGRVQNLVRSGHFETPQAARAGILASDKARSRFIRQIAGVEWDFPGNFNLILDGTRQDSAELATAIQEAFQRL